MRILSHVLEIAKSKETSTELLQGFGDGKCWAEPSTKKQTLPHWDCYWILLSTHVMNRLMLLPAKNNEKAFVVLAAFCDGVSKA